MMSLTRSLAFGTLAAVCLAGTASGDELSTAAFAPTTAVTTLNDDALRDQRGKFVLAPLPAAPIASVPVSVASVARGVTSATAPAVDVTGASRGTIVYFGLALTTTWSTQAAGGGTATYTADAQLGIDLSGKTPAITLAGSSSHAGGDALVQPAGTVTGSPADGRVNGVLQAIAVAGNGNQVSNGATVDISAIRPNLVVTGGGSTCGSSCTITLDPKHFGVAIALPNGSAAQGLGPNGLFQNAQVASNFNAVSNTLHLGLQTKGSGSGIGAGYAYVMPLLTGIRP